MLAPSASKQIEGFRYRARLMLPIWVHCDAFTAFAITTDDGLSSGARLSQKTAQHLARFGVLEASLTLNRSGLA